MLRNRRSLALLGVSAVAGLVLTACSSSGSGGSGPGNQNPQGASANTYNTGTAQSGGTFTYTLEKDVPAWNVNSALGNTFETDEVVEQIYPSVWNYQPDTNNVTLNTDLVVSAQETKTKPETLVYKIQPKAKWSDGSPINV